MMASTIVHILVYCRKALTVLAVLSSFCLNGCGNRDSGMGPSDGSDSTGDLVALGFEALKTGDLSSIEPLLMNQARYRQLIESTNNLDESEWDTTHQPNDEEIAELEKEARDSLFHSVQVIHGVLDELQFDLEKCRLAAVLVFDSERDALGGTRWIEFQHDDPRTRLDINYLIESEGNVAQIKLNDVFLIKGQRYLARGFHFRAYRPNDSADDSIHALVAAHHLTGPIPRIPEKRK